MSLIKQECFFTLPSREPVFINIAAIIKFLRFDAPLFLDTWKDL